MDGVVDCVVTTLAKQLTMAPDIFYCFEREIYFIVITTYIKT